MTRAIIVEQILRLLDGGRNARNGRWKMQEILLSISEVRNALAREYFFMSLKNGDSYIDAVWLSTYDNVDVYKDTGRNLWYSNLPATPIALPDGKGINMVSYQKDQYNQFIPLKNGSMWMFGEVGGEMDLQGNTGFFQEGKKIYFPNYQSTGYDKVLIKLVADSADLGDDDFFAVPPDAMEQIVKTVVSMYAPMQNKPVDLSNNNNPSA